MPSLNRYADWAFTTMNEFDTLDEILDDMTEPELPTLPVVELYREELYSRVLASISNVLKKGIVRAIQEEGLTVEQGFQLISNFVRDSTLMRGAVEEQIVMCTQYIYGTLINSITSEPVEDTLESKVISYLRGHKVDGITDEIVDKFYAEQKKTRFLIRDERDLLHKPKKDGDKKTSSIKLNDILPD